MIRLANEIRTENPNKEMWQYLSLFCNYEYCLESIINRNKEIDLIKDKDNIKKQIAQIRLSLKQAEEYFSAAATVSLITKPLLIYYGYVALSRALILLKNDGTYSYDYMRMKEKHNHHGLNIKKNFINNNAKGIADFLASIKCEINYNNEIPWGNFTVFYNSLDSDVILVKSSVAYENSQLRATGYNLLNTFEKYEIASLKRDIDLLSLFKHLPDFYSFLKVQNIQSNLFPGFFKINSLQKTKIRTDNKPVEDDELFKYECIMNNLDQNTIEWFIDKYAQKNVSFSVFAPSAIRCIIEERLKKDENGITYLPDATSSISEEIYFIKCDDDFIIESASHYMILFMLSILCRYYPDIWVSKLSTLSGFSELISYYMDIAFRKTPNLILNQMSGVKYVFN